MTTKNLSIFKEIEKELKRYGIKFERTPTKLHIKIPQPEEVAYNPYSPRPAALDFMTLTLGIEYDKSYVPRVGVNKVQITEKDTT